MHCLTLLSFSIIFGAFSACQYNATIQMQHFFLLSQRQLQSDISTSELMINSVEQRAIDHIDSITERNRLVLQYIRSKQQTLFALQVLNSNRRRCMQQYSGLLVNWGLVEQMFASCLNTTKSHIHSVTRAARNALHQAKNEVNTLLPKAVGVCNRTYAKNDTRLEECLVFSVDIYSKRIKNYIDAVDNNLFNKDQCVLPEIYRNSIQCAFEMEKDAIFSIGMVKGLVEKCLVDFGHSIGPFNEPVNSTFDTFIHPLAKSSTLRSSSYA